MCYYKKVADNYLWFVNVNILVFQVILENDNDYLCQKIKQIHFCEILGPSSDKMDQS